MTLNDDFVKNGKIRQDGRMVHDFYLFQVKTPSESKVSVGLLQADQHDSGRPGFSAACRNHGVRWLRSMMPDGGNADASRQLS